MGLSPRTVSAFGPRGGIGLMSHPAVTSGLSRRGSVGLVGSAGWRGRYTQGPMHREASPDVESASAPTARTLARRRLRLLAVLLNVVLFATGLYFQAHPRDRNDLWSAGGVAAVAIVNSASLTDPAAGTGRASASSSACGGSPSSPTRCCSPPRS